MEKCALYSVFVLIKITQSWCKKKEKKIGITVVNGKSGKFYNVGIT